MVKMPCESLKFNRKSSEWGGTCLNKKTVSDQVPLTEENECWFSECCEEYRGRGKDAGNMPRL